MIRTLLALLSGIFLATTVVATLPTTANAIEKQYYWNGSEKIIVKHPYFSKTEECKDAQKADQPCNESVEFTIDRNTRDGFRFTTEGHNDTIRANGVDKCTFMKYYLDVKFVNGQAQTEGVRAPNGADAADVDGGSWRNLGANNDACQKIFNGNGGEEGLGGGLQDDIRSAVGDLNKPFTISGVHGRDGHLTALEDQLSRMYEREKKHFVHRICSTHHEAGTGGFNAGNANCKPEDVEKAYKVIWDYCRYDARSLSDEALRVSEIKSCIQSQSGVMMNSSLIDGTSYNVLSYADTESCSIKFIGWIVCPMSRFLANITDAAFDGLSQFLTISPLNKGSEAGDALFSAWSLVNNIANVLFIFAFLAVIISQVTGWGISNYGIKRLLPRLILTAVFVNISYYVCVIAVDASNILGRSLIDIISTLEPDAVNKPSTWTQEIENILVFTAGAAGVGMVLLTGSIVAMFPLLVGAALSFLVAILMIVARYALVIILIIIAPFAIALALLPNTQKWYSQWQKLFISMLMLYPMISIVFGLSKVAGILVLNSSLSRSTGDITLQLFGLAIMALPLALTPILMRLSGGVLNRFGGVVSSQGFFKGAKEKAQGFADRKRDARDVAGLSHFGDNKRKGLKGARDKMIQRRYRRSALQSLNEQEKNRSYADYISGYTTGKKGTGGDKTSLAERGASKAVGWAGDKLGTDWNYDSKTKGEKFAKSLAQGGGSTPQVNADAIKAQLSINADEVKAAKLNLQNISQENPMDNMKKFRDLATNQKTPDAIRQAAIELVTEQGSMDDINAVVKASGGMNKVQRQTLVKGVSSGHVAKRAAYYTSPEALTAIRNGNIHNGEDFTQQVVTNWINSGEVSAENVGKMHAGGLEEVQKALRNNPVSAAGVSGIDVVSAAARAAQASTSIQSDSHGTRESIATLDAISRLR